MEIFKRDLKKGPVFYLRYKENGKWKSRAFHKYLGFHQPIRDQSEAKVLLADLHLKEFRGQLGIQDVSDSLPVAEFYLRYFRYCDLNKALNTVKSDKERLGKWIRFLKRENIERVAQITLNVFRSFSEQELRGNANATRNRYASIVRASFNWGIREEYLKENPLKNVIRLKEIRPDRSASFRQEDLAKLFSIEDKVFVAYIKLIYYTLMRRSEALNLRWNDVDFRKMEIVIRQTKSGTSRTIPLNKKCLDTLRELQTKITKPDPDSRIFTWSANQITKKFQRLRKGFGLQIDGIHHFRHLGASELLRRGANPRAVQELLGHSTMRTTMEIYAHVSAEGLRETVNKM